MGIFRTYFLHIDSFAWGIVPSNSFWKQAITEKWRLGCYFPYISLGEMPREDLTWAYHAICHYVGKNHVQIPYEHGQHYVPGSILTVRGHTLIGGIRDRSRLCDWNVAWRTPHYSSEYSPYSSIYLPSTDCGSIVVDPLVHLSWASNVFKANTIPILSAGIVLHYLEIYLRSSDEISKSWIAQAFHLDTSLRSRGYVDEDGLYQIYGRFTLRIEPLVKQGEHFRLCDTFMAEDPHTLWLFIHPPVVDYPSNKVSSPVLSWLYDGDSEISLEEAEKSFDFKLVTSWELRPSPCSSLFTAISDLNAEYGFDPARGGIDVCEHHGWPVLEIFDTSKSMELEGGQMLVQWPSSLMNMQQNGRQAMLYPSPWSLS
ncbi:hypothetical protein EV421DRAFT_276658 [Armillaria borealis]|uniref:Uncharacterized protein n=1 Tax=Armillaria borealis TaxID=47425 RepID=A0AA39MEH5_9AGAR|nr:hypothetical protein EV421DRAFT_276658 [Armillaria borealis]